MPVVDSWHTIALTVQGRSLTASLVGRQLATVPASAYASGLAGIAAGGWYQVNYRDLTVTAGPKAS